MLTKFQSTWLSSCDCLFPAPKYLDVHHISSDHFVCFFFVVSFRFFFVFFSFKMSLDNFGKKAHSRIHQFDMKRSK